MLATALVTVACDKDDPMGGGEMKLKTLTPAPYHLKTSPTWTLKKPPGSLPEKPHLRAGLK